MTQVACLRVSVGRRPPAAALGLVHCARVATRACPLGMLGVTGSGALLRSLTGYSPTGNETQEPDHLACFRTGSP